MNKNDIQREWRKNNPEKMEKYRIKALEQDRLRRKTKHRKEYMKRFREKHKEQLKEYQKKYNSSKEGKTRTIKYSQTFKAKIRSRKGCRKRKMKKYQIVEVFTAEEWSLKLKKTKGFCPKCKRFIGIKKLELDHIFPISKAEIGRIYTIKDIQPLCNSCNSSKGNRI